eukprot:4619605-Pyramimonas_sp.AAC.1
MECASCAAVAWAVRSPVSASWSTSTVASATADLWRAQRRNKTAPARAGSCPNSCPNSWAGQWEGSETRGRSVPAV